VLPLGLTDKTPVGRRRLAHLFCGLAAMVVLTTLVLQGRMPWFGGVLVAACLLMALRYLRESKLP
jgi:hypothetical protein